MDLSGARRLLKTDCPDTANQYLRFGWKLINQQVVDQGDGPTLHFVLASMQTLADTRQLVTVNGTDRANVYLELGWKMIEKAIKSGSTGGQRDEIVQFVLAWQADDPPRHPEAADAEAASPSPAPEETDLP